MVSPLTRRSLVAAFAVPASAGAQTTLPYGTIRIFIGYPSSGGSDSLVHVIAGALQQQIGRSVTVDYKPGPSGAAAGEQLKKSAPNGNTLAFIPSATMVGKLIRPDFPFNPQTDLQPLTLAGTYPTAFAVSPKIGVADLAEYVAWLKAGDATRARFGTTTPDSFTQYFGTMVGREIGVPLEAVPYNGARPLVADLEQGRIPAGTGGMTSFLAPHRGGRLKVLMISAAKRLKVAPQVPTVVELGFPKLVQTNWYAFFAPPGMSAPLVAAWTAELRKALQSREVSEQLGQLGFEVQTSSPDELSERLASDFRNWKELLDSLGVKPIN
ncbi:MAG: tripartite tricarboxylate transporter substrate-binding protein [Reyranella sp.]|nr:tripartite tricarboxylate transporter substrate-binding protein [Reyranella sp.]